MARFPVYLGVAQLVACYLGVVEAAGSSPVTQTRENPRSFEDFSELRGVFAFRGKCRLTKFDEVFLIRHFPRQYLENRQRNSR